jgi:hypothetical protein
MNRRCTIFHARVGVCSLQKRHVRTRYAEVVCFASGESCSASVPQNINALFFVVAWDRYGLNKKCVGTRYNELVFLHSLGYASHVVYSSASGS